MKFLSTLVTQGTGVVGNLVMERNGVIRNRNNPANPSTLRQDVVRARLGTFSSRWSDTLTDDQRNGWIEYAGTLSRKNAIGMDKKTSGIAAYVGSNAALDVAGEAAVDVRPTNDGDYALPPLVSVVMDDSSNTAIFTFSEEVPAGVFVTLFLSPGSLSLGRMTYSGPYQRQLTVEGSDLFTVTFAIPATVVAAQKWGYRLAAVTQDGQVSKDVEGLTTVIA